MRHHDDGSVGARRLRAGAVPLLAGLAFLVASCGKSPEAAPKAPTAPSKDFKAEAKTSIDEKNMDAEMQKLKSEIETDSK